jgi:hypothetical protein
MYTGMHVIDLATGKHRKALQEAQVMSCEFCASESHAPKGGKHGVKLQHAVMCVWA